MKKFLKALGIVLLILVAILLIGYFYLRSTLGGNPDSNIAANEKTKVEVSGGTIVGGVDDGVYTYLGVPYASATERFVPAEPTSWNGIFNASEYGNISPQQSFFGSEDQDNDCLNLNIWTNGIYDGEKRPVLVWFHGGGLTSGSANEESTNGRNLAAKEDVVVVTVNHRLGVSAYLDLADYGDKYSQSGNVGVLDMVASLQWIQDNIEVFGGDPNNVTIFGQSGGGAKVLALMTSPNARGLFHKAINQSGATDILGPVFATKEMSKRVTELTLSQLNITKDNIENLQTISFEQLNAAGSAALSQVAEEFQIESPFGGSYMFEWMPVVDGDIIPTHPVTDEGFAECGKDIPLLIGSNLNEWEYIDSETTSEIIDAFQSAYPNIDEVNASRVDAMLRAPLRKITTHKADQGGAPIYSYVMTYGAPGSTHGFEIPLIFANASAEHEAMSDIMSSVWAQFARTGNPTIPGMPEWEPYTREGGATMLLDINSSLGYNHDEELLNLLKPGYEY